MLWLLCAFFSLAAVTPASGRQSEVVDSNVVLSCGNKSHPLAFAHHRTKIGGVDAEAFSVILKTAAPPNKVFSLYRYRLDPNDMRRDDDEGKAGQIAYNSNTPGAPAAHVRNFLRASFGNSFDETGCADPGLITSILTSLSTSPPANLFDIVNGARPGAKPAERPGSPFSAEPANRVKFSEAVFNFGTEWGFGVGGIDPNNLSKEELIQQRDEARKGLDTAKGQLDRANGALEDTQKKLDAATQQANVRWWIVLGTLGYGLLATLAWLSLVVRSRKERKFRPVLEQGAEVSYPGEIKEALLQLVRDTNQKSAEITERMGTRHHPRADREEFRREHQSLIERVEKLFTGNGYVVPKGLSDLLAGAKKQFHDSWQFVPVVGRAMSRLRDAVRLRNSKAYEARNIAKSDYREFVRAIEHYANGLAVKANGKAATRTEPEPAGHARITESLETLAATVKGALTAEVNPVLKKTVEDAISAEFKARSGEWVDLIKGSHSSRDALDRVRAALPLIEPGRELNDAEVEAHLTTLFSGVEEVRLLFAPGQCSSASSLLREVKSLRAEYQRLGARVKDVDSLPQLLGRMEAKLDGFRTALSPVAAKGEDLLVCAQRIADDRRSIAGRIKESVAFKCLVEQDGHKAQLPLVERVSEVIELAGEVPRLRQETAAQLAEIGKLQKDRDNHRAQAEGLAVEVSRLKGEVASQEKQLGELETSAREFQGTYAKTVNSFLQHLGFRPEEADPAGDVLDSLRTLRRRADKAVHERALFRSLRLRLLPGVELLEGEIAETERRGRGDVVRALSLNEGDKKLNIVENLRKIISQLEAFDGDNEKLWEHGFLEGFANGWLHHLLRADRLLQVYFADSAELAGLRNAVKGVALPFEIAMRELGVRLFETKLLSPIPADQPITRTKVGEITKVPEIKEAVEMTRQNGGNFVVDIIHFGLGGRSGVNEEVRIALMNPVDWA